MEEKQHNILKKIIAVLLVLLLLCITALAGVRIYKKSLADESQSATVHNNIITPDKQQDEQDAVIQPKPENNKTPNNKKENNTVATRPQANRPAGKMATKISLHKKSTIQNTAFNAVNMFPGDVISNDYCVQITHEGSVPVYFDADVRDGYEKLAEVMKCKVTLLTTDEVLFDGLMKDVADMVKTVNGAGTSELIYRIDAYLDTSVGNEYQNLSLVADFEWWVENEENLRTPPDTGDITNTYLWIGIMTASLLCLIILILFKRKKEEADVQ